jgi:DNA-binding NarL/FixJ family response regulator
MAPYRHLQATLEKSSTAPQERKITVFIVDDHPIMREGLKLLIMREPDLVCCGEAGNSKSALMGIEQTNPQVALIDLSLEESSGIDLIKTLRKKFPQLQMLVVTMHDESLYAERALKAGARGYIMKQEATENVITALRHVLKGEIYLSRQMESRMLKQVVLPGTRKGLTPIERLSNRELEVFELIGRGRTTRQISKDLHLSIKTIETNRARIKEKLNLKNGLELVRHAIQWVERAV